MKSISFSGIDGSGKSTQIELLKRYLDQRGKTYRLFHLFSDKGSVSASLQNKGIIRRIVLLIKQSKNSRFFRFINLISRMVNVFIDSWVTSFSNKRYKEDLIIYDRYYYDILAVIMFDFPGFIGLIKKMVHFIPSPDYSLVFYIDPAQAIKRKNEHTQFSAKEYCRIYAAIGREKRAIIIKADQPPAAIHRSIVQILEHGKNRL